MEKLPFIAFSNFLVITSILLANWVLRMSFTTLIVKSKSTLSILCSPLNHAPERIAFVFKFINCFLLRNWKLLQLSVALAIVYFLNSRGIFSNIYLLSTYKLCMLNELTLHTHREQFNSKRFATKAFLESDEFTPSF